MGTCQPDGHSSFINRTRGLLPAARSPLESGEGESIIKQIAATDVKMKYRFNTCAFRLTNHAPGPGDSQCRHQLKQPNEGGQTSATPQVTNSSPWGWRPKAETRLWPPAALRGDGRWLLHTHHLVSPAQARKGAVPACGIGLSRPLGAWQAGLAPPGIGGGSRAVGLPRGH